MLTVNHLKPDGGMDKETDRQAIEELEWMENRTAFISDIIWDLRRGKVCG